MFNYRRLLCSVLPTAFVMSFMLAGALLGAFVMDFDPGIGDNVFFSVMFGVTGLPIGGTVLMVVEDLKPFRAFGDWWDYVTEDSKRDKAHKAKLEKEREFEELKALAMAEIEKEIQGK